jgi:outer membrane lipoprotein SlyB
MKHLIPVSGLAALISVSLLSGCVTANPDVVRPYETQRMSQVLDATVLSVRPVVVDGQQSGAGGVAGGVVGAVAGSSVGGQREGAVVGVLGAVAGAVIGNAIERNSTRENALEIIVQLRNGERRAIVQGQGADPLNVGDAVILVTTGGRTVVRRAPPVAPASNTRNG